MRSSTDLPLFKIIQLIYSLVTRWIVTHVVEMPAILYSFLLYGLANATNTYNYIIGLVGSHESI